MILLTLQASIPTPGNPIRDWSGWFCTVGAVLWSFRQHYQLKNAKAQVEHARHELHRQRVLQVVTTLTATVTQLGNSIESGKRLEVRHQCSGISGDLAHLRTYGGKLYGQDELNDLTTVGRDVQNVLQTIGMSDEEFLTRDEKSALRNFSSAALVNMRASQGRFEKAQDLQEVPGVQPKTK